MALIKNKIYRSILILLWLLMFTNAFATYKNLKTLDIPATILEFDITLKKVTMDGERGVFYYDTGKGINKEEVKVFEYSQAPGETKHYRVPLATNKKITKLRFDPLEQEGEVIIKNLRVQRYKQVPVAFVKDEIEANPKNSIEEINVAPDTIHVKSTGKDPHFIIVDNFARFQVK